MKKFFHVTLLLVLFCALPAFAQTGRVVDVVSGSGIPGATVSASVLCQLEPPPQPPRTVVLGNAQTDANGQFNLTIRIDPRCPIQFLSYSVSKQGYIFDSAQGPTLFRGTNRPFNSASAASFLGSDISSEMIVAGFGQDLATSTESASTTDLPTTLAGRSVVLEDFQGNEKTARLFFVSTSQINYLTPAGLAEGPYVVKIVADNHVIRAGFDSIRKVTPGVFAANSNGEGVAAAVAVRVKPDGSQQFESIVSLDTSQNKYVAAPIDLGSDTDRVVLVLFGTGWRNQSSLSAFSVKIGGTNAQVQFAGKQPMLPGLDQLNALIPRSLIGSGEVDVELIVDGISANKVKIAIR